MDSRLVPLVGDCDLPPLLNREITEWLARELLRDLKGVASGPASGTFLTLGASDIAEVEAAFAGHGYRLEAVPELVTRASGWWWQGAALSAGPDEG